MKMSDLKKNEVKVRAALKKQGNQLIAKERMRIVIPTRYRSKQLARFGSETQTLGIFMYVLDDNSYALSMAPAIMTILPDDTKDSLLDGQESTEFIFEKGSVVVANVEVIRDAKLLYYIYNEVISTGNVPAFFDYLSLGRLFDFAMHFTGTNPASSVSIMHLLISLVARDPKDLNLYFRQSTTGTDFKDATYISIRSTTHGANNTIAKIMGGYFSDKVTSALVNPATEEEPIEHILRA